MKGDHGKLYLKSRYFYELEGSAAMMLSASAAVDVCRTAAGHKLVIARIEGGIWHNPGFEARYDCIWDGADPPLGIEEAKANNELAAAFIDRQSRTHGAFILTAPSVTGWPHKQIK